MPDYYLIERGDDGSNAGSVGTDSAPWSHLDTIVTALTINGNITYIGQAAFFGLTRLTSVNIPASVDSIGDFAFAFCSGERLEKSGGNTSVVATGIAAVTGMASVTKIGDYAFFGDSTLAVPNPANAAGLADIGEAAFGYCRGGKNAQRITIPASVKRIGELAFGHCLRLDSVGVAAGNTRFIDVDGALFNRSKDTLIYFPPQKTVAKGHYAIPGTVKAIGVAAFEKSRLTGVTIPLDVNSIGAWAFADCHLENISIPAAVDSIGYYAFAYSLGAGDTVFNCSTTPQKIAGKDVFFGDATGSIPLVVSLSAHSSYEQASPSNTVWGGFKEVLSGLVLEVRVNNSDWGKVTGTPSGIYLLKATWAQPISLTAIANKGYDFDKWTDRDGSPVAGNPPATYIAGILVNSSLIAHFKKKEYKVIYHRRDNTSDTITYFTNDNGGNLSTIPPPSRTGYQFIGWYASSSFSGSPVTTINTNDPPDTDINLYAKWKLELMVNITTDGKEYDGTDTVTGTSINFYCYNTGSGVVVKFTEFQKGDDYTFNPKFDAAAAGERTVSDTLKLVGGAADDFVLVQREGYNLGEGGYYSEKKAILRRAITISGAEISATKVYDGTKTLDSAHITMPMNAVDLRKIGQDEVYLSKDTAKVTLDSADVQSDVPVELVKFFVLTGKDSANYELEDMILVTASVTRRPITLKGGVVDTVDYSKEGGLKPTVRYLTFNNVAPTDSLEPGKDYTIGKATYDKQSAGSKTVTIDTVKLKPNSPTAKNYSMNDTNSYTLTGYIRKIDPTKEDLIYTLKDTTYNGMPHPRGVTHSSNGVGNSTSRYEGTDGTTYGETVAPPINAGRYTVTAYLEEGDNFNAKNIELGTFAIKKKTIAVDSASIRIITKIYDGTKIAEVESVEFAGLEHGEALVRNTDYTVDSAVFDDENAGGGKTATAYISLMNTSAKASNYALRSGQVKAVKNVFIVQSPHGIVFLSPQKDTTIYVNDGAYTLRAVDTAPGVSGLPVKFELAGNQDDATLTSDSVLTPKQPGTVVVAATVEPNSNYENIPPVRRIITITDRDSVEVTFDPAGGTLSSPDVAKVAKADTVKRPFPDPTNPDHSFGGWYADNAYKAEWNFSRDRVRQNTILYAKWGAPHSNSDTSNCGPNIPNTGCPLSPGYTVPDSIAEIPHSVTYGDPDFGLDEYYGMAQVGKGEKFRWASLNPEVAAISGFDRVKITGVGESYLLGYAISETWEVRILVNVHLTVRPKPLSIAGTWVDTIKIRDGSVVTGSIAGELVGLLPQDEGKVAAKSEAYYADQSPLQAGVGKLIVVEYAIDGSRAYCYIAPTNDTTSGTVVAATTGTGSYYDVWGVVMKQDVSGVRPFANVNVAYAITTAAGIVSRLDTVRTDAYGKYFVDGLEQGGSLKLTPESKHSWKTSSPPQPITIGEASRQPGFIAQADTIFYVPDVGSIKLLAISGREGKVLKSWERDSIENPASYELFCGYGDSIVIVSYSVVATTGGEEDGEGTEMVKLEMNIGKTMQNSFTFSVSDRKYTVVVVKPYQLFDLIAEHMGNLRVVINNPAYNGGLMFTSCQWWHKKPDAGGYVVASTGFYYSAGPLSTDLFTPEDSMFVRLYTVDGDTIETCPDADNPSATAAGRGMEERGGIDYYAYPNPVMAGSKLHIKPAVLSDENGERFSTFRLYSSQGQLVMSGSASIFAEDGLTMPETPGAYYLILNGRLGKRAIHIAVVN
jgi:uncharacterized repeat protein (TIGR02543 family)